MAARGRPRRRKILSVMFDTNAIFTKEFDTLISQATKDLIARHSNHGDLSIRWVIPEVVRGEREYQMRNEYRGIASHLTKAERLFGQEWGITQDAVEQRIAACIMAELATQHIDVVPCDIARVDWADIMRRSCFREPPFERGPTEKGFRDAVVCETFIQLASDLVGRDTAVLVSNDRLIKQYIDSYGLRGNTARVIDDLDALHDEIQLRVANVDEDTQVFIEQRAQQLFYPWDNADDPNCLWIRERLYDRIRHEYRDKIMDVPAGSEYVSAGHEMANARLISKDGTRVHFATSYNAETGYRVWVPTSDTHNESLIEPPPPPPTGIVAAPAIVGTAIQQAQVARRGIGLWSLINKPVTGEWVRSPNTRKNWFVIRWSATFSRHRTLTRATIDSIDYAPPPGS